MSETKTPTTERARKLYRPPFKYDPMGGYIWDSDGNMVADEAGKAMRLRGWGRIGYMENPEALQDAVGELIANVLTEGWGTSIAELRAELAEAKDSLQIVRTPRDGVWFWQGDGKDDLPSLVCPVVMSAETFDLAIENAKREAYGDASKMLFDRLSKGCTPEMVIVCEELCDKAGKR